jgi:2-polyprenyl-3-methyl-5-hydroxy-6-metoxy-1,4-benzoquinol methylase
MPFKQISRWSLLRSILVQVAKWRVKEKVEELIPNLKSTDNILDIGSGNGMLCYTLMKYNFKVTPLDVDNFSFIGEVKPIIYNAVKIPFKDSSFNVALLITVLHHAQNPKQVLAEARRVANRIIVIEEIYSNKFNKYLTYFVDSIFNFEFIGHPHTNMTDTEWREVFAHLGLKLLHASYKRSILVLKRVTYILENDNSLHADVLERASVARL